MLFNTLKERQSGLQGIKEYEPRVVHQLLDFMYRNVAEVLQVAEVKLCESYHQHRINEYQLLVSQSNQQGQPLLLMVQHT